MDKVNFTKTYVIEKGITKGDYDVRREIRLALQEYFGTEIPHLTYRKE